MQIRVLLFGPLADRAGSSVVQLELPEGATAGDTVRELQGLSEGATWAFAVNAEYAAPGQVLKDGDEVALIPPVSGG